MPLIEVNGTKLHYVRDGQGTACVIMHGGLGLDHTYLRPRLLSLSKCLELIFYDQRCCGKSERVSLNTLTFENLVDDAEVLRKQLGLEKIVLLGHSYGGFIALNYALRYPSSLSHLILVSTAASIDYWSEIEANMLRRGATKGDLEEFQKEDWETNDAFKAYTEKTSYLLFASHNVHLARSLFQNTIFDAATRNASMKLLQDYNIIPRLHEIRTPTLIIVGREDVLTPPSQAQRLKQGIPNSKLVIFEKSGHIPYLEESELFLETIIEWLSQDAKIN